ncbi:MAG: hypothetical protein ACLQNE_30475 [Thermoguttaceae bacterium]
MDEDDWNDDEDTEGDADEAPDDDDRETTVACPYCKRQIHEDSYRCPYCENYISKEDTHSSSRKPWWIIVGVLLVLYVVYRWIVG